MRPMIAMPLALVMLVGCDRQPPPATKNQSPIKESKWSKAQAGLRCRLTLPRMSFPLGEKLPFTLEIQNVSDKPIRFQLSRYHKSLKIRTQGGKDMPYQGPRSSTPAFLITLPPNETYRFDREVLQENYLLAAGTYVAHFEEKESGGEGFVEVTLATPPVPFEIVIDGGGG